MVKQLELLKRPRVALIEEEEEVVRVRLPKVVATAVAAADPADLTRFAQVEARLMLDALCTPWFCWETPPSAGLYELTDHVKGTERHFWWYTGASAWVMAEDPGCGLTPIFHHELAKKYAWRGLREMPASYPPPYRKIDFAKRGGKMPRIAKPRIALEA